MCLILVPMILFPANALGHLLPVLSGTIRVEANNVYVVLSLPVDAFQGLQLSPDGRLDADQYDQAESRIHLALKEQFILTGGKGSPELIELITKRSVKNEKLASDRDVILAMMEFRFQEQPQAIQVKTSLFGHFDSERQLTLKASNGRDGETAVLTPIQDSYVFFDGPMSILFRFISTGIEHILLGWDHVLFLLTLLVSNRGFRSTFILLTSFTLAHSATFFLAAEGLVHINTDLVELAIAATIILTSLKNLLHIPVKASKLALLVFACGLIHGLGFASSIATIGVTGQGMILTLLGFNVGIEIGQLTIVLIWIMGIHLLRQVAADDLYPVQINLPSWISLSAGLFWFFERMPAYLTTFL